MVAILLHGLLVELPEPFDEIQIRGVGRDERQDDVEFFCPLYCAVVVLRIVEQHDDRDFPLGILLSQLFQKCFCHQRVTIVLGEQNRRMEGKGVERSENGEALAAAVALDVDGVLFPFELPLLPVFAVVGGVGGISKRKDDFPLLRLFKQRFDLLHPFLLDVDGGMTAGNQLGLFAGSREFFLA